MKDPTRQQKLQDHGGEGEDIVREDTRGKHCPRPDRRQAKPAENALLAKHHQLHAQSPEAAHHRQAQHWTHQVGGLSRIAPAKDAEVKEKKRQRHHQAEEDEGAVAQRQPHARLGECPSCPQSRSLLPVSSRKTSSSEGAEISRLESSFPCASRCFTRATMVCGGRVECSTYRPSISRQSATPSSLHSAPSISGCAQRTSMRVVP